MIPWSTSWSRGRRSMSFTLRAETEGHMWAHGFRRREGVVERPSAVRSGGGPRKNENDETRCLIRHWPAEGHHLSASLLAQHRGSLNAFEDFVVMIVDIADRTMSEWMKWWQNGRRRSSFAVWGGRRLRRGSMTWGVHFQKEENSRKWISFWTFYWEMAHYVINSGYLKMTLIVIWWQCKPICYFLILEWIPFLHFWIHHMA